MKVHKHHCSLGLGSDSMLPQSKGLCSYIFRMLRKPTQISQHHPYTYEHFYSYPAIMAERQKNLYGGRKCLIHPFSMFSLIWRSFMIIINLAHMVISTLRLFYVIEPVKNIQVHLVDHILMGLNIVCMTDIFIHFHTGYIEYSGDGYKTVIMDRRLIIWHYLSHGFMIHFISCLPLSYILLQMNRDNPRYIFMGHLLPILRVFHICSVASDLKTFIKIFTQSYIWVGLVGHFILFFLSAHWCSCVHYIPPVFHLYWFGEISKNHTSFLKHPDGIMHFPLGYRYKKSIFIALSGFFSTGYSMFKATEPEEILLHALVILYSALFIIYNFVFMLKIYMTIYSSTIRYNELMNQVEEYMTSKQFPSQLRKRVLAHYNYRYQERFFSESTVLNPLSEELSNEITLHTCYKLVDKVALFKNVPADIVGSVLGCLQPEVFLPNDSVLRAGDIGDCMYFIANGTVAVYSLKGVEVCHLEDGAHFGEVALLMKDSKRVATVVAVEITELYRLDAHGFKQFILPNKTLYQRIEETASKRMHETVLLDEELRKEREPPQEKHDYGRPFDIKNLIN